MKEQATTTGCPQCGLLKRRVAELESRLAKLEKNSSNSSKPPSSDIVKPAVVAGKKRRSRRNRGAQPGHPKHERPAFPPEEIDRTKDHQYERCPECDGPLEVLDQPARLLQQIEIVVRPTKVTEHRSRTCRCPRCRKEFVKPIPRPVRKAGLVGPRLTALIGYLKGACHCSFSTIRKFLRDVVGVSISRGQLRKVCGKVARSLDQPYQDLLAALPEQERLNVDETGHKEYKQAMWTWCFRAPLFTLFKIAPSRGSDVLLEVLGAEFDGVLGCDYFSAYRKYLRLNENVLVQFCLAHLIRDVRFLVEHPNSKNRAYGKRVLQSLRDLFGLIHRRQSMSQAKFLGELEDQGYEVWTQATDRVPQTSEAQNLAKRFRQHGREYLRFITTPGVEPTNNLAEQAIRFVVIDRRITQGSRSLAGREWLERIWTAIATCTQHGQSVFDFLNQTVRAFFAGTPPPSLLFGTD
jgi:transposase